MTLTGQNLIAGLPTESGAGQFTAAGSPRAFDEASDAVVHAAVVAADRAFEPFSALPPGQRADFLDQIAVEIEALGDGLLEAAHAETALPIAPRLTGERTRTLRQLRLFADLIREGSWVQARIDRARPDQQPPRPDIRRMLTPLGPVAVFSASNFPLAFSVAGTDTASALAAGCPVVVKAHPAHPATSELTAGAIVRAASRTGMPAGVFALLHSTRNEIALALVRHPRITAVAFTGSLTAGRALFDAGVTRPDPIPVYAEMGSVNPVFLLPGALAERTDALAEGLVQSVTLGVGQFCTCPGLAVGIAGADLDRLVQRMESLMADSAPGTMLYPRIRQAYETGWQRLQAIDGVRTIRPAVSDDAGQGVVPTLLVTDAATFLAQPALHEEVFGPSTVVIGCESSARVEEVARSLEGQLTATLHGTAADMTASAGLAAILERKAGRVIWNGFPTGVEVCAAMHHGGRVPPPPMRDPPRWARRDRAVYPSRRLPELAPGAAAARTAGRQSSRRVAHGGRRVDAARALAWNRGCRMRRPPPRAGIHPCSVPMPSTRATTEPTARRAVPSERIRIAVVGLGKIARDRHLPAIAADTRFELVATVSPQVPGIDGVPHLARTDALLADGPGIDAVALCTPPVRGDLASQAIAAGCHVLLEKPPGATKEQAGAESIVASARRRAPPCSPRGTRARRAVLAPRATGCRGGPCAACGSRGARTSARGIPGRPGSGNRGLGRVRSGDQRAVDRERDPARSIVLDSAVLSVPENRAAPIAARLGGRTAAGAPVSMDLDWRQTGLQTQDILVETDDSPLVIGDGGARLRHPNGPDERFDDRGIRGSTLAFTISSAPVPVTSIPCL
ncbi:MAG: aldehyde dehydrogenase family protein [Vicinamibacterales bacterium]